METWFPRIGAVAVLIGAGFAFKYAIDRGYIGQFERVMIGVFAGVAFLLWGLWAYRRGWDRFAQAVTAGGIALLYLSTLAAFMLYHLISGPTALVSLTAVVVINALLALFYNSLALALMATIGGFINPLFVATRSADPVSLYVYIAFVDLAVVVLSLVKRWRPLELLAFAGTWLVLAGSMTFRESQYDFFFVTLFFVLFSGIPFLRTVGRRIPAQPEDVILLVPSGIFYFIAGMALLDRGALEHLQGPFVLTLGAAHLGVGLLMLRLDRIISTSLFGLAIFFFTTWMPIQFDGFLVPTGWGLKGLLMIWLSRQFRSTPIRNSGVGILGLSFLGSLTMLALQFDPSGVLASAESLNTVAQIAALYLAALLLIRDEAVGSRQLHVILAVAANLLTLFWLSAEAAAYYTRTPVPGEAYQFTLSAIWALYAAGLLVVGVSFRMKWARLLAVGIFVVTMIKMSVVDLWLLSTGYRTLAFIGFGLVLLLCSMMYHRFKEFILGPIQDAAPPSPDPA